MKHGIRWALVSVGLAGVVMAVTLAPGGATPPAGLTNTLLALGRNTSGGTIPLKEGTNIVVAQITVHPGRLFWLALPSGRRDRGRPAGLAHGVRIGWRSV